MLHSCFNQQTVHDSLKLIHFETFVPISRSVFTLRRSCVEKSFIPLGRSEQLTDENGAISDSQVGLQHWKEVFKGTDIFSCLLSIIFHSNYFVKYKCIDTKHKFMHVYKCILHNIFLVYMYYINA